MKREDFIAAIGFQGNTAFIDSKVKKRYGKLSSSELFERGLYRTSFCAALFDDDSNAIQRLIEHFATLQNGEYESAHDLKRLFGVDSVPEDVAHVKAL